MRARESREWRAEDTGSSSDKTVHQGWLSDVLGHSSAAVEAKTYRQSDYAPTWFPDNWIFNVSRSEEKESDLNPRNVCHL